MTSSAARRFASLPTAAKLLLILTAVLLPIGIGLAFVAADEIRQADRELRGRTEDQARAAVGSIESLIARNALALRVASSAALAGGASGSCERAQRSLATAPAVARAFELVSSDGTPVCRTGALGSIGELPLVAPGAMRLRVAPDRDGVVFRVGVIGGMATGMLSAAELRTSVSPAGEELDSLLLSDGQRDLSLIEPSQRDPANERIAYGEFPVGNSDLNARVGGFIPRIRTIDRLLLLMPVLMWILAALMTWFLVSRLLIRPLKQLQRGVVEYQPGHSLDMPRKLGPATEISELRDAFTRAFTRVEESEKDMSSALEGQRRLVREVHHRVKNNLQVVASLLNIQGRSAPTIEARAAYAAIGRRVGALSMVHRNHFAEMEENRGIALRPLVTELSAELRAGAPEEARALTIDLEIDTLHTTQDVAVAVAFLITEIVEYAMFHRPDESVEISLRRCSDLTARLLISSPVLVPDDTETPGKVQFERIVSGLAKQLRSPLDRKLGRYCVELPVFPGS